MYAAVFGTYQPSPPMQTCVERRLWCTEMGVILHVCKVEQHYMFAKLHNVYQLEMECSFVLDSECEHVVNLDLLHPTSQSSRCVSSTHSRCIQVFIWAPQQQQHGGIDDDQLDPEYGPVLGNDQYDSKPVVPAGMDDLG